MATKKDANGDPLCATCLDARHAGRRAEFVMLHEARASAVSQPQGVVAAATTAREKIEFVRIARSTPMHADSGLAPRAATRKVAAQLGSGRGKTTANGRRKKLVAKVALQRRSHTRSMTANRRALERRLVMLVIEVGFLRAQQLLDDLKTAAQRAYVPEG